MIDPQRQEADIYALKQQISALQIETNRLNGQIQNIQNTAPKDTGNVPQIVNFIRNGDISHSDDTYFQDPSVANDTRYEAWEIFWHTAPVAGQNIRELSIYNGDALVDSTALPDPSRSDSPTIDPNWAQIEGYIRLGSTNSIDFPLPSNVAFPGRRLYVSFIAARASANVTFAGSIAAGIWDNTSGQRDFLPAGPFTINATTVGLPAATVSRDYYAVGILDNGRRLASNVKTNAAAPSDASFVSGSVYNLVSWTPFPGLSSVDIYRDTGGTIVKLKRVAGGTGQYFDDGYISESVGAYPPGDSTIQTAYAQTRAGALSALPINGIAAQWSLIDLVIQVPGTYDQSLTTDKQWLRIFLTEAPTGTDAVHGIFIDLVSMSFAPGVFSHHPDDLRGVRQPIAAPNGSSQGGTGPGGGPFNPPDPGDGGIRCIWEEAEVLSVDNRLRLTTLPAKALAVGMLLVSPENDRFYTETIASVSTSWAETTLTITTELGQIRCSLTEPFRLRDGDKWAQDLMPNDQVLQFDGEQFRFFPVKNICISAGCNVVKVTLAGRRKYFLARNPNSVGWFELHNLKPNQE